MKKIAILTSGGDAPGMNACVRACVRYAIAKDVDVYGVEKGYVGLLNNNINFMSTRSVSDIIQRDKRDQERATAPLKPAEDALVIDTSDMTADDVYAQVIAYINERI